MDRDAIHYPRGLRKASIGRRILISWIGIALFFFLLGFGMGMLCSGSNNPEEAEPYPEVEKRRDFSYNRSILHKGRCSNGKDL